MVNAMRGVSRDTAKGEAVLASDRVKKRQAKTRARIVEAAYEIMACKGVDAATIQEITETADTGFGTFYNYFASKDEVAMQVLDCVVNNLGLRNRLATEAAGESDPVAIFSNSYRLAARELYTNPMWRWWLKKTDLTARRLRTGFARFALDDIADATSAGALDLSETDPETIWSFLMWLFTGTLADIVEGDLPKSTESSMAEAAMRILGVPRQKAHELVQRALPDFPELPIDFHFKLEVLEDESAM
jgi:AcrR family transcriptional regulator